MTSPTTSGGATTPAVPVPPPDEVADLVAAAARAVPGVTDLHTGTYGEVATYLPGRRVNGVRLQDQRCEVHVVVAWGSPVVETAHQVQAAVSRIVDTPVDVTVEDIVDTTAAGSLTAGSAHSASKERL